MSRDLNDLKHDPKHHKRIGEATSFHMIPISPMQLVTRNNGALGSAHDVTDDLIDPSKSPSHKKIFIPSFRQYL